MTMHFFYQSKLTYQNDVKYVLLQWRDVKFIYFYIIIISNDPTTIKQEDNLKKNRRISCQNHIFTRMWTFQHEVKTNKDNVV